VSAGLRPGSILRISAYSGEYFGCDPALIGRRRLWFNLCHASSLSFPRSGDNNS